MTEKYLLKILKEAFIIDIKEDFFKRLYEPEYYIQPIDENKLKKHCPDALVFDYKLFNFEFMKGEISCTGLTFEFCSDRFERIFVQVFYDSLERKIYNSVLAMPKYTEKDYRGKLSISQRGRTIKSNTDVKRMLNYLYKRFECPSIK